MADTFDAASTALVIEEAAKIAVDNQHAILYFR
jgi:hypothetical protein